MGILKTINKKFASIIKDRKMFNIGTYGVLCAVSVFMTVMNIITDKGMLTACTAIFAGFCLINILLTLTTPRLAIFAKYMFAIEVILMFTFFLVSGNPEGFSAIWICMLPSLGMIFFDRFKGSMICLVMFGILVFFLWTPVGNAFLLYEYTESFKMRFPVLFVAFHFLAFFLESLRQLAYNEVRQMENYYKDLSVRDQLTGMFNRQGMYSFLESSERYKNASSLSVAMFDIDFFKQVNDNYGHKIGDIVLKRFADIIKKNLGTLVCRWGGEEFVVVYPDDAVTIDDLEQLRRLIEKNVFTLDGVAFGITVSIGVCKADNFDVEKIDFLIEKADEALYQAKKSGRNRIVRI